MEAFDFKCKHTVYGDFKPFGEIQDPAFYIHVIQKMPWVIRRFLTEIKFEPDDRHLKSYTILVSLRKRRINPRPLLPSLLPVSMFQFLTQGNRRFRIDK